MFKIEETPKAPTGEKLLRLEFMVTIERLKSGQYFDVPYSFEGMGKKRVVSCVFNYLGQYRKTVPEEAAIYYRVNNTKKEKGGYSRISMYEFDVDR